METVIPRLHASEPEPLPFGRDIQIRAFLLERPEGNVVIYRSAALADDEDAIEGLGGVARQYLNHQHEASPATDWVRERFGAPLLIHTADEKAAAGRSVVDHTFDRRHTWEKDLEIIPTPGHTPGATAYLWDTGEHRVLFPGDTVYFNGRGWSAAVLDSSDRESYVKSLELLMEVDFDVLAPSVSVAGAPAVDVVGTEEARRRIGEVLRRVRGGG